MHRFESRIVKSFDGTRIAYHVAGSGPLILLANGLGGTRDAWQHQLDHFGDRYRLVTWDYRGTHGSSPPPDESALTMGDHVGDALALLDAVDHGRAGAIVMGWSIGAQVAFELYKRSPERVRGIVAINGLAGRPWDAAFRRTGVARALAALLPLLRTAPGLASGVARRLAQWPESLAWMRRLGFASSLLDDERFLALARAFADVDMRVYLRALEIAGEHDARDVLPAVRIPVLVIVGERDWLTPCEAAESIAVAVPGAELMIVSGGTHYVLMEYADVVNLRIEKFLRERGLAVAASRVEGSRGGAT